MKISLKNFLKSIIIGLGGVAPGLSGSVLMIIFGLYRETLDALSTFYIDFKKKIKFLFPVICGIGIGVIIFSKLLDFLLVNYEVPTRFAFLGLILGTVPLFYEEVKKNGFAKRYYIYILVAFIAGMLLFTLNTNTIEQLTDPNFFQKVLLGVIVVASAIVPGIDQAVLLSTFGLYEIYVSSVANLNFSVLLPMLLGVAVGAILISFGISKLFKYFYTATFSIIFGAFLSMIPNILNEKCYIPFGQKLISYILIAIVGFLVSFYMGDIQGNNKMIKKLLKRN